MRSVLLLLIISTLSLASTDIIYGEDGRIEVKNVQNSLIQDLGDSIAARVGNWSLDIEDKNFSFSDATTLSDNWGAGVCSDEKFANQITIADCTGFLVGEDLLVTAGHCALDFEGELEDQESFECSDNSWVFGYQVENGQVKSENLTADNLYKCKEVVRGKLTDTEDFAIIKLDRKVVGRTPLKLRNRGKIKLNDEIFVMGHPSGLPLKYSGDSFVTKNNRKHYFSTNLDTFGGNSGSPVFNARTLEVEGILVRGRTDYVESEENGKFCLRVNKCDMAGKNCLEKDEEIDGEQVNRVSDFIKFL